MNANDPSTGTDPQFKYQTDQFADLRILRYQVPGFNQLTLKQKEMLYYLYEAALCGRDITWDQNYKYNLAIRKTLEAIVNTYKNGDADEEYQKLYKSEQVISMLSNYFAFLAIFISSLGLLGLAMFTTEQRSKEIGIRKALGASVGQLFTLLSGEFLRLVLIALVIASPLAWWIMNKWLQDYAYRTKISWMIFIVAGSLAFLIALLTVSFQAIRAAITNPVKNLRTE